MGDPYTDQPRPVTRLTADEDASGDRLDRFLAARLAPLSRARITALIRAGHVTLASGAPVQPSRKVAAGEVFDVTLPEPVAAEPEPEDIELAVVHEDDDLIVIDKPAGLVVHPGAGHDSGTLVNALIAHCGASLSGIGGVRRPGIVHRLDKDTSGLMVIAKNDATHAALAAQFADHGRSGPLERAYLALVWGIPPKPRGVIDRPIGRHRSDRTRQAVVREGQGRHAVTRYEVVAASAPDASGRQAASLVRCVLETGRTHQIRVHMAHIGAPVIGDPVYGSGFKTKADALSDDVRDIVREFPRQALHAAHLGLEHPGTGAVLRFDSPIPQDMAALRTALNIV